MTMRWSKLGISSYLMIQSDMEVKEVREASNSLEGAIIKALELHLRHYPHGFSLDVMDGIEATQKIMADWPQAKIIIVTS